MAITRIKDRISELVNSQLPEHIRTDYTTFVAFLEYYYKFLEQDQGALELVQNARQYSDIDQTTSSFVNYFLTNYAKDLPYSLTVNKPLLIKRIADLYAAKGSSLSIETLFRILYDTAATTRHPYDFVLRPSDGQWDLRTSLRVQMTSGSAANIKDRFLNLNKNNINYNVEIVRVKALATNLYEIFYKTKISVPFEIEDDVVVNGTSGAIFTGTVKPTTTGYSISQGGTGFRAGQIFNVSVNGAVDTLVRITKVSTTGAIEALKFLNYGYNYTEDLTIVLTNALGVSARSKAFDTTGGGFSEAVRLIKPWTAVDAGRYFDTDYTTVSNFYTGNLLRSSSTTSQVLTSATITGTEAASSAVINFTVSAIARYPGQYTSTQGFLSEPDVRLQDNNLYQPFAYQIESELDISTFYNIVKKLVHQAGTNMFVNRTISATANIKPFVEISTRKNVAIQLNSVFNMLDTAGAALYKTMVPDSVSSVDNLTVSFNKSLSDSFSTVDFASRTIYLAALTDSATITDSLTKSISVTRTDSASVTESIAKNYQGVINNTISNVTFTTSVNGQLVNYVEELAPNGYFAEVYVGEAIIQVVNDVSLLPPKKAFRETVNITESITKEFTPTGVVETVGVTETLSKLFMTSINNTDSTVSVTDTTQGISLNYTDALAPTGYFAEVYGGESIINA